MEYLMLIGGLAVLIGAGELLVKGAVGIALQFRISPLVIGMTIVSFGTSAPELLVSAKAALEGHPGIAIGNVVGSNISNLGLVLGITALILPLPVDRNSIRIDWPAMMLATVLFGLAIWNLEIERWEGIAGVVILVAFIWWLMRNSRKKNAIDSETDEPPTRLRGRIFRDAGFVLLGCIGLVFGANWLVDGAVLIAQNFGVSDWVIGVTVIAFGTSVPELATSTVAAFRGQTDISIGNLVGSNLFNIMAILGITSSIKPISVDPQVLAVDLWWLLGVSALVFPIIFFGRKVTRWKGAILVAFYGIYIWQVLQGA